MPSIDHFQHVLHAQLREATKRHAKDIVINAGELHRAVGGYPGPDQRLRTCCDVMKAEMRTGDAILGELANAQAATLMIRYQLPRPDETVILSEQLTAAAADLVPGLVMTK